MQNYNNTLKQEIGSTSAGENPKETKRGTKKTCQPNWSVRVRVRMCQQIVWKRRKEKVQYERIRK